MKIFSSVLLLVAVTSCFGSVRNLGTRTRVLDENETDVILDYDDDALPVLKFCCRRHYYLDYVNATCVHSGTRLEPQFYSRDGHRIEEEVQFLNVTELNSCPSYRLPDSEFRIMPTGEIQLRDISNLDRSFSDIFVPTKDYCLLWVSENDSFQLSALVCFPDESEEVSIYKSVVQGYLIPISMAISACFLAATFIIYCLVSELQDLLGKSFMCSVAALCFSKVLSVVALSLTNQMSLSQCVTVGLLIYFGFLLAFFWLNVISFILFVSVCFQGKISTRSRKRWFLLYSVYAFGVPLLIMTVILIHDFTNHFDNSPVPKPGIGIKSCGFANRGAQVVYFYAPISILLGINLILFCASACRLFILSKQSSAFVFQFTHYLKLLVLMGIPWIFEVLSFFFSDRDQLTAATFVWLAFDLFNSLQGIVIFIVFACRRAVFARASETLCGSTYARDKYPDVFLQHANEETNEAFTQDLRLMDADNNRN